MHAIERFAAHVGQTGPYEELWRWSVEDIERFWAAVWEFFDVQADGDPSTVLASRELPGARWFPDVALSYPEHVFRDRADEEVAIRHASETRPAGEWTWGELRRETGRVRAALAAHGVGRGDRVAAVLPNVPEAVAAFLATASLGAVWTCAAPELGAPAVIERFAQIEPKVLLAVDGYRYGERAFDCAEKVDAIAAALPGARVVRLGYLDGSGWDASVPATGELAFARVPFDAPLWVLYSSGTTGAPKALVHGHGGILLEQLKHGAVHLDAGPGDRVLWFTTTSWMMWNFLVGVLLTPASIVLYDGSPAGTALWDLAADAGVTIFGTGAAFLGACMKEGIEPRAGRDLSALRAVGSTGSPLSEDAFAWVREHLDVWLFSTSGGTDVCTAFVGGVPTLPVRAGELQARSLGCDVQAWDERGRPLVGEVGELVLAQPIPSMPVCLWGDRDGARYRETYLSTYPGVWRHGDWIEIRAHGGAVIHGRSDATINRGGVRIGTSEIYGAVLREAEVVDALVVDVDGHVPLFVVLAEGVELDDALVARIRRRVREDCSPRHVPDEVLAILEVPRTLSGKALEVPVKRILLGLSVDVSAVANPAALEPFRSARLERSPASGGSAPPT